MPASPPRLRPAARPAVAVEPAAPPAGGFVVFHPRYRSWLIRAGLDTADALLALPGEIVCGHADRHVARVELAAGSTRRVAFLKREHQVGWPVRWKNRRAGFGWVSRAEREAETLRRLEAAGLPGPQWLAYGTDGRGRAFLLVDEVGGAADMTTVFADSTLSPADRRLLAERVGRAVAELHEAGFGTPELAAKHVLIGRRSGAVTLLDWQSAPRPGTVTDADRARQLAGLAASLADQVAGPRDRACFLWAYSRVVRRQRKAAGVAPLRFGPFARAILADAAKPHARSSKRDQRLTTAATQRLVWLAGEQVCVIPEMVAVWPNPPAAGPFYPAAGDPVAGPQEWVTFPNGRRALLARFASTTPLGRAVAAVRAKPWRSPGATVGRLLFHLEKYGVAAPHLLGFGQRLQPGGRADSFALFEPAAESASVTSHLADPATPAAERAELLRACGRLLRKLHDAGCRLTTGGRPGFVTRPGEPRFVAVGSPADVQLVRRIGDRTRRSELRRVAAVLAAATRADRTRVVHGYTPGDPPAGRRTFLRSAV